MDANITLMDDPLRILRGFRFSMTTKFKLDDNFMEDLTNEKNWNKFRQINAERIRYALEKNV